MLNVSHLTRDYGQERGIFDVDFSVERGEVFGFLGPNGAGKTTTIRHLMGFLRPRRGNCTISGKSCWQDRAEIQRDVGYIPGEMAFLEDMTGDGYLRFYAKYRGMADMGRQQELLSRFELEPKGKLKKMSKGMKQKIGIVAAFMHDPGVLVLDEPTSGLDPLMQNRFIELILEEKERGKTILMSSHMFEEVERTCHRIAIIREGRIVTVDSVDAIKAKQHRRYVVTLGTEDEARRFAETGLTVERTEGTKVTVCVPSSLRDLIARMYEFDVVNLSAPTQSLEEIFLQYYGGNGL